MIIISSPQAFLSEQRLERWGSCIAYFMGCRPSLMLDIRDHAPDNIHFVPVGDALNTAAEELREVLINVDKTLRPNTPALTWEVSDVADRGPYASRLQANAAQFLVFSRLLADDRNPRLFLVEDPVIACMFFARAQASGQATFWRRPGSRPWGMPLRRGWQRLRNLGLEFRSAAGGVTRIMVHKFLAARARRRTAPRRIIGDIDAMVVTWVREDTFPSDEPLNHDAFLRDIPAHLRRSDTRICFLANPMSWLHAYGGIADNVSTAKDDVVLVEELVSWTDVLTAPFRSRLSTAAARPRSLVQDGVDFTPLLRAEIARGRTSFRPARAWLYSRIGAGLKRRGIRPTTIIHSYENQPWEKALRHGTRQALPAVRTFAVQIVPFSRSYLSFFPSSKDVHEDRLPSRLLTMGPGYTEVMADHGFPRERMDEIGAIRLPAPRMGSTSRPENGEIRFLCACGIEYEESLELAFKAAIATSKICGCRLLINFHPATGRNFRESLISTLRQTAAVDLSHVEISEEPANTLIETCRAVLYNVSGGPEAVISGIPAIYVGREANIDQDKVPDEFSIRRRSVSEIQKALRSAAPRPAMDEAVARWFGEPRYDAIVDRVPGNRGRTG